MTASVELQWNGPAFVEQFDKQALSALQKAGQIAEETAQGLARVRTGFMRDSVYVIVEPVSSTFDASVQRFRNDQSGQFVAAANVSEGGSGWVLIVGDSAPYAIFNEVGTVYMSAQPFIRPGGDRAAQALPELLARGG
jgi:HK97 gp10 family phage protein